MKITQYPDGFSCLKNTFQVTYTFKVVEYLRTFQGK